MTEAHAHNIEVPKSLTVNKDFKYTFRKDALGNKRPNVNLQVPVPNVEGLVEALSDQKQLDFVLSLVSDAIYTAAKTQVNDEVKPVSHQKDLDLTQLTLKHLAYLPPSQRGDTIDEATKEAFVKDYVAIMPALTGKTEVAVGNAALLFRKGLRSVKNNKDALAILQEQLAIFISNAGDKLEEYSEFIEILNRRLEDYLAAEEVKPEDNL